MQIIVKKKKKKRQRQYFDITLPTKVHLVKAMVFHMYGCESWTIKKAACRRIDAFVFVVLEKTLESLGLQGDQTSQS